MNSTPTMSGFIVSSCGSAAAPSELRMTCDSLATAKVDVLAEGAGARLK